MKLAFIIDEFSLRTPAQQLLDRFLIGYPPKFQRATGFEISVFAQKPSTELDRRVRDLGLKIEPDLTKAVASAHAIVRCAKDSGINGADELLPIVLELVPPGSAGFVYGAFSTSGRSAARFATLAQRRKVALLAGTALPGTWRLPQIELPKGTRLDEALMVVQGPAWQAELNGLDSLLPIIERRRGGEAGVRAIRHLTGDRLWRAGDQGDWSWPLLASALSRSDSPQGDAIKDGRTQDLVGLGLVPKLARQPRGWLLEHRDGLRSTVLILDGVVADYNFAVRQRDGKILSAQIYRPPAPAEHEFTPLSRALEDFFRTGKAPWRIERNILEAGLLELFKRSSTLPGEMIQTPELKIAYQT